MTRFYGAIGFSTTEKTSPGVYEETIKDRYYYGDVKRNTRRLENGESINDNINVSNNIEIIGDDYAFENFFTIRYICWMGSKWKISDIDVQRPRLILTIGGLYNGDQTGTE